MENWKLFWGFRVYCGYFLSRENFRNKSKSINIIILGSPLIKSIRQPPHQVISPLVNSAITSITFLYSKTQRKQTGKRENSAREKFRKSEIPKLYEGMRKIDMLLKVAGKMVSTLFLFPSISVSLKGH